MKHTHSEPPRGIGGPIVSCATCSEIQEEELIRIPGGWVITRWSAMDPGEGRSRIVSSRVAAQWLIRNGHALPEELETFNFEID